MEKIIGTVTTYRGNEYGYLCGCPVQIAALIVDGAWPGETNCRRIRDDETIARLGGVCTYDRIEAHPYLEREDRFSVGSVDVRAADLDAFAELRRALEASGHPAEPKMFKDRPRHLSHLTRARRRRQLLAIKPLAASTPEAGRHLHPIPRPRHVRRRPYDRSEPG